MSLERSDRETRFLFHGNAYAVGGNLIRPDGQIIETRGSVVLPQVGGGATATVEDYNFRDLISFRRARSKVLGNVEEKNGKRVFNTLATVALEDVNIADLVTADRVVARLVSERIEGEQELPMLPVGSSISNLRIAGEPVDLKEQTLLYRVPTLMQMSELRETGAVDGLGSPLRIPRLGDGETVGGGRSYEEHRVLTSLYGTPSRLPAGCFAGKTPEGEALYPWAVHIQGFGTVYFGELLMTRHSRTLTMIRVRMGCPECGDVQLGSTQGNGSTYP